jgi:glycosyltransferase involved in cell wall biosynthesis
MTPLVSFVVPTYNVAHFVAACLDSIFAQTATNDFEIILVNDASPDDTDAVVRRYDDPRLHYIRHTKNCGSIITINEGFARARGTYIARIDSDDRYRPNFLERTLPVFEKFSEVGLVYGDIAIIDADGNILEERVDTQHGGHDTFGDEYLAVLQENFVSAPTVIARREAWDAALPIPDGLGFSDWYLTLRIARVFPLYFCSDVLAEYRLHTSNRHRQMVRDYSEEKTILRLLDQAFSETDHATEKKAKHTQIYAIHSARLGDKYFGQGMYADARRCYLRAARMMPRTMLNAGLLRRFAATFSPNAYARLKRTIRSR